jgi:hypothetical protein
MMDVTGAPELDYSLTSMMTDELYKRIVKHQNDIFIEALKRKGHEFKTTSEVIKFIKKHVRCEDHIHLKEKRYFVDDVPFLLYDYRVKRHDPKIEVNAVSIYAECGSFAYL